MNITKLKEKINISRRKQLELDKLDLEIAKSTEKFSKLNQEMSKKDGLSEEDIYQIVSSIIESGKLRTKKINLKNPKNKLSEHYYLDTLDKPCRENFNEILKMTKLKKQIIIFFFISTESAGTLYNRLLTTTEIAYYPLTESKDQDKLYAKVITILYKIYQNKQANPEYRYQDFEELHNLLVKFNYLKDTMLHSEEVEECLQEIINSSKEKDLSAGKAKQKTKQQKIF